MSLNISRWVDVANLRFSGQSNKYSRITVTAWKVSKCRVFSGPFFPAFGLNTDRYGVSLRIQSESEKTDQKKTPYLDTFHAVCVEIEQLRVNWPEAVSKGVLWKKVFLRETGKHLCQRLHACNFIKKVTLAQVFSCQFCEFLRTPFL